MPSIVLKLGLCQVRNQKPQWQKWWQQLYLATELWRKMLSAVLLFKAAASNHDPLNIKLHLPSLKYRENQATQLEAEGKARQETLI